MFRSRLLRSTSHLRYGRANREISQFRRRYRRGDYSRKDRVDLRTGRDVGISFDLHGDPR